MSGHRTERIDVRANRTGWLVVTSRGTPLAHFVGVDARDRAIGRALTLAESRRMYSPVVVVIESGDASTPGRRAS